MFFLLLLFAKWTGSVNGNVNTFSVATQNYLFWTGSEEEELVLTSWVSFGVVVFGVIVSVAFETYCIIWINYEWNVIMPRVMSSSSSSLFRRFVNLQNNIDSVFESCLLKDRFHFHDKAFRPCFGWGNERESFFHKFLWIVIIGRQKCGVQVKPQRTWRSHYGSWHESGRWWSLWGWRV